MNIIYRNIICHLAARLPDDAARHVVADHHLLRHVWRTHRARQLVAETYSKYIFYGKIFVLADKNICCYLCHLCTLEKATMSATGFMWSGSPAPVSSPKFGMIAAIGPRGVSAKAVFESI